LPPVFLGDRIENIHLTMTDGRQLEVTYLDRQGSTSYADPADKPMRQVYQLIGDRLTTTEE
jgi:hypothetical protein